MSAIKTHETPNNLLLAICTVAFALCGYIHTIIYQLALLCFVGAYMLCIQRLAIFLFLLNLQFFYLVYFYCITVLSSIITANSEKIQIYPLVCLSSHKCLRTHSAGDKMDFT